MDICGLDSFDREYEGIFGVVNQIEKIEKWGEFGFLSPQEIEIKIRGSWAIRRRAIFVQEVYHIGDVKCIYSSRIIDISGL